MIKIEIMGKGLGERIYNLSHRKDRRFGWKLNKLIFKKIDNEWRFVNGGIWNNLNRECVLKIESILRGLNSR